MAHGFLLTKTLIFSKNICFEQKNIFYLILKTYTISSLLGENLI